MIDQRSLPIGQITQAIKTLKPFETIEVSVYGRLPNNSWTFVEGQVLDEKKEYLFSFGKELWAESGRDADGVWSESDTSYSIDLTIPNPGLFYLKFESDRYADKRRGIAVIVTRKNGSWIPHFWFGLVCLLIGVVLNEIKNKWFRRLADEFGYDDE